MHASSWSTSTCWQGSAVADTRPQTAAEQAQQWEKALRIGLVGPYMVRYNTSNSFRAAIDNLRAMIPSMITGLAAASEIADAEAARLAGLLARKEVTLDEALRQAREGPGPPPVP